MKLSPPIDFVFASIPVSEMSQKKTTKVHRGGREGERVRKVKAQRLIAASDVLALVFSLKIEIQRSNGTNRITSIPTPLRLYPLKPMDP